MERVYHYTTMDAFLCLLESVNKSSDKKSFVFRATNIFYLNDPSEYIYGQEILMEVLKHIEYEKNINYDLCISNLFERHPEKDEEEWQKILIDIIHEQNESPYIISFSRNVDSLPMWLNYGDNGKGVCLAFAEYRSRFLDSVTNFSTISEVKVEIYDSLGTHDVNYDRRSVEDKDSILRKNIELIYDYYLKKADNTKPNKLLELQTGTLRAFSEVIAPYIKTKEYEGEREVRMAKTIMRDKNNNIKELNFRCNAKGHIIPYINIEIPTKQLDYVRIGPLADNELSTKVLGMMKKKYEVDFDVRESEIMFRDY